MAHKVLDGKTAVGVSRHVRVGTTNTGHGFFVRFRDYGATPVTALAVDLQGSMVDGDIETGIVTSPGFVIGTTNTRVANVAFMFKIDGVSYNKGAVAAGTAPTAAHVIGDGAGDYWGCVNYYITTAGVLSTRVPFTPQVYASAALAMAAADLVETPKGLCYIGRILINMNAGTYTAGSTALTGTTSTTYIDANMDFVTLNEMTFSGAELAQQCAWFNSDVAGTSGVKWVRLMLVTLTGDGIVDAWYHPYGG